MKPLRLDEDREALGRLWSENMRDSAIAAAVPARLRWLYEEAPFGAPCTILAVEDEGGEVIGCGSYLPRPLSVDGRRVRGAVLCDFAVARAHRIAGAALAIQRALAEAARAAGIELLFGYPNAKSLPIFKRVGYRVAGETSTWVKPLRAGYKVRSVAPALAPLAAPAALALAALDRLRGLRAGRLGDTCGDADAGPLEEALFEAERTAGGLVLGEKTAAYVAWRYRDFTTADHGTFRAAAPGSERLEGWAAYARDGGKAFLRELALASPASAEATLLALARHLRGAGVDSLSVTCLAPSRVTAALRRAGFFLRPERRAVVVHAATVPEALRAAVLDPARWFMLEGDLDI